MKRLVRRWIAGALLSISMVAVTVGASYDNAAGIGSRKHDKLADTSLAPGPLPKPITVFDAQRKPGY